MNAFDRRRYSANLNLAAMLGEIVRDNPDLRFSQILRNYLFVKEERPTNPETMVPWANEYYLEPEVLLERVRRMKEAQ